VAAIIGHADWVRALTCGIDEYADELWLAGVVELVADYMRFIASDNEETDAALMTREIRRGADRLIEIGMAMRSAKSAATSAAQRGMQNPG
jgi:hypothetical protein